MQEFPELRGYGQGVVTGQVLGPTGNFETIQLASGCRMQEDAGSKIVNQDAGCKRMQEARVQGMQEDAGSKIARIARMQESRG